MKTNVLIRLSFLLIASAFVFSCCTSKGKGKQDIIENELVKIEINTFKVTSESRVKDINKLMDAPYLYDLQVEKNTYEADSLVIKELKELIANDSSFLTSATIPQCKPNPDFFIQLDSTGVYGFHLDDVCPILLHLEFIESETKESLKYINTDMVVEFQELTKTFFEQ